MSKATMHQTYNFEALHDKGLAEHFLNAGKHLSGEVEVLGSAIRCIMLTGDNLSNKEIILQLIHALEITEEPEACDVIRNTLEIVVGFTRDDIWEYTIATVSECFLLVVEYCSLSYHQHSEAVN